MSVAAGTDFLHDAAMLVAGQRGATQRIQLLHQPRKDGSCRGCGVRSRTRWPCVLIIIAELSDTLDNRERGSMTDPKKPDGPGKHEDDRDGKGVPRPDKWKDPNKK